MRTFFNVPAYDSVFITLKPGVKYLISASCLLRIQRFLGIKKVMHVLLGDCIPLFLPKTSKETQLQIENFCNLVQDIHIMEYPL